MNRRQYKATDMVTGDAVSFIHTDDTTAFNVVKVLVNRKHSRSLCLIAAVTSNGQ